MFILQGEHRIWHGRQASLEMGCAITRIFERDFQLVLFRLIFCPKQSLKLSNRYMHASTAYAIRIRVLFTSSITLCVQVILSLACMQNQIDK